MVSQSKVISMHNKYILDSVVLLLHNEVCPHRFMQTSSAQFLKCLKLGLRVLPSQ